MFTATWVQVATYLLGVCPFSIAFLVFLNSSVSFIVTDLIDAPGGAGDAVGTLGFADELLALLACPVWGVLSDRIGVRAVCVIGYLIIGISLILFVQSTNVYPQLLLGRLFFSLGASAASTMVTTILPSMTLNSPRSQPGPLEPTSNGQVVPSHNDRCTPANRLSISSELTITPARIASATSLADPTLSKKDAAASRSSDSGRVAGFVGIFAGCGALLALGLFLPLPARLGRAGASPEQAWKQSYYIVAAMAVLIAIICFFGLRNLQGEEEKGLLKMLAARQSRSEQRDFSTHVKSTWSRFSRAFMLGFRNGDIGVGYVAGFVARASSVGLSLFIPLLVNAHFQSSGLCLEGAIDTPGGLPDLKRKCPKAYILAAQLSGAASLVGLIVAHPFGYASSKSKRLHLPLVFASVVGIVGYVALPITFVPEKTGSKGSAIDYLAVSLLGMSQIGAVVSSLAIISAAVLEQYSECQTSDPNSLSNTATSASRCIEQGNGQTDLRADETLTLLPKDSNARYEDLVSLKGAIAGIYSLFGGAGILLLTKLGGYLFDSLSFGAPFYIMAVFNGLLLLLCVFRIGMVYTAQKQP